MGTRSSARRPGAGPLAAFILLTPLAAHAQSATAVDPPVASSSAPATADDVLVLRNGTVLRGRIAESVPGTSVRIVLADGEVRRLAWDEVASARGPTLDLPGAPTAEPRGFTTPSPLLSPGPNRVPLRIESPARPLYLLEPLPGLTVAAPRGRREQVWRQLCQAPCTLYVQPGPHTLQGSNTPDGSHGDVWTGVVRAPGTRVQVWTASSLAASDWVAEPEVRTRRDQVRDALAAQAAWDRQTEHQARIDRSMRGVGDALMITGGSALHGALVLYLTSSPFDHCAQGLFRSGCDGPSAALALMVGGLTGLASGAVLALLGMRDHHAPPRPQVPDANVELPLEPASP